MIQIDCLCSHSGSEKPPRSFWLFSTSCIFEMFWSNLINWLWKAVSYIRRVEVWLWIIMTSACLYRVLKNALQVLHFHFYLQSVKSKFCLTANTLIVITSRFWSPSIEANKLGEQCVFLWIRYFNDNSVVITEKKSILTISRKNNFRVTVVFTGHRWYDHSILYTICMHNGPVNYKVYILISRVHWIDV